MEAIVVTCTKDSGGFDKTANGEDEQKSTDVGSILEIKHTDLFQG